MLVLIYKNNLDHLLINLLVINYYSGNWNCTDIHSYIK